MKDVTATSFGLIIAFLLPGLSGLYSLTFWSEDIKTLFVTFLTADSNVGLFFLVLAVSFVVGLQIALLRAIVFERLICRSYNIDPKLFRVIGSDENRQKLYMTLADAHYKYHQFWGGMCFVIPVYYFGLLGKYFDHLTLGAIFFISIAFILLELITIWGAVEGYKLYVQRANNLLGGIEMPNGLGSSHGRKKKAKKKPSIKRSTKRKATKKKASKRKS